jgi:probable addiction module antidote protein
MPKGSSYRSWQIQKLADPAIAASYLNEAISDSREMFLKALGDIAQAHQVAKLAKDAGVQRETLYRSFSEQGNPTFSTLYGVLKALGVGLTFTEAGRFSSLATRSSATQNGPPLIPVDSGLTRQPCCAHESVLTRLLLNGQVVAPGQMIETPRTEGGILSNPEGKIHGRTKAA